MITLGAAATIAALVVTLTWGAAVSLAVNAEKYYEDTNGNICLGVAFPEGFPVSSCEWGAHVTGGDNTGAGRYVLKSDTSGNNNSAFGEEALEANTTGVNNTVVGHKALYQNQGGDNNTALGEFALCCSTGSGNTAVGQHAGFGLASGAGNILLGQLAGEKLAGADSDNIDIGNEGEAADEHTTRIGTEGAQKAAYVAGVYNVAPSGSTCGVVVNTSGQLGCGQAGTGGGAGIADFTFFDGPSTGSAQTSPVFDAQGYTQVAFTAVCVNPGRFTQIYPEVSDDGTTWIPLLNALCSKTTPTGPYTLNDGAVGGFATSATLPTAGRYYRVHNTGNVSTSGSGTHLYVIGQFSG